GSISTTTTNGVVNVANLRVDAPGTNYFLTASTSFPVLSDTSAPFGVFPPRLRFTAQPTNVTAVYRDIAPSVQVRFEDAGGIPITDQPVRVTVALGSQPGPATLSGTTSQLTVNGVATFADLSIDNVGIGYTLLATSVLPIASTTTSPFDVTPGAPATN